MKVIIIEDETPAANRLAKLLQAAGDEIDVVAKLDSVAAAVHYFQSSPQPDLIFMDIQLADGLSFDIFFAGTDNSPGNFYNGF